MQGGKYPVPNRDVHGESVEMVPRQLLRTRENLISGAKFSSNIT
jgi:hypothetical protein